MQDPGNYESQLERVGARIRAGEWARRRRAIGRRRRQQREERQQREYEEWEQQMETEWLESQGGRG